MSFSARSSRCSLLTALGLLLLCLSGQIEQIQAQNLSNADFEGRYAITLTIGLEGCGTGVVQADGAGGLKGSLLLHVPGETEAEKVSSSGESC